MLSYQLSILTIKSPKNFSLFLSWWNSFTQKNRHRRHDKTRERCIRSKDPLLSAKLWGQRLQRGGATWMRRIPFPISPKEISFFWFKMIFGIPFKVHVSKTLTRDWRGAVSEELSMRNCSRPPFRLPGAVTPVTPVNAPLVGLAPRVQEIWWLWANLWNLICQGSVELEHISYWLLTSGSQSFCLECVNELNETFFFWEYYIYLYIHAVYMYISSTIRIAYCWEYNILYPLRNFFTKEWAEPMPGVHASATKDEKEESSSTPKKTKSFTSHVFFVLAG